MNYPGGKNGSGVYQKIISLMPPHKVYIEAFLGGGAILRQKKPAIYNFGIEIDDLIVARWMRENYFNVPDVHLYCGDFLKWMKGWFVSANYWNFQPKDILIYADPPYLGSVRSSQRQIYRYDMMRESAHIKLLEILKNCLCNVMISGYDSPLYNEMLSDWRKVSFTGVSRGGSRTEVVWMNFPEPLQLHDYSYLGENYRERENIKKQQKRWKEKLLKMPEQKRFALLSVIEELKGDHSPAKTTRLPTSAD